MATCSKKWNMLSCQPMKVHGAQRLRDFSARHPQARTWVQAWLAEAEQSIWARPQDIKDRYRTVSFVGRFVIFNVKGNDFRMATIVAYQTRIVLVKWIGPHDEYMKINWEQASNEGNSRQD